MAGDVSPSGLSALLVLADGRFPIGGHVHSAGVESAMADGRITDVDSLRDYVVGHVHTVGLTDAALVARTVSDLGATRGVLAAERVALVTIDAEADARLSAAPLRAASRRLGRQLGRVAGRCWPDPTLTLLAEVDHDGAHQSVALGTVAAVAGLGAREAAVLALHHAATTPLQAAVKLGGLDPFEIAALTVDLGPTVESLADAAVDAAARPLADLPSATGPVVEIAAMAHAARTTKLFAT